MGREVGRQRMPLLDDVYCRLKHSAVVFGEWEGSGCTCVCMSCKV